ncbi:MAG: hypothetical protein CMO55_25395 [Verrucomicrobiales bacterium]|nr:hypothetical protein [Verrucomicrobiales bacterium]
MVILRVMMNSRVLLAVFAGVLFSVQGLAQEGVVSGVVYEDENGNGVMDGGEKVVPGAKVVLFSFPEEEELETVTSGPDGSYTFGAVPPGEYQIQITFPSGITVITDPFVVAAGIDGPFLAIPVVTGGTIQRFSNLTLVNPANVRGREVSPFAP